MRTLRGEPVDRPAVNFYEIGGVVMNPDDPNPFNVFNDPSWRPLIELAEQRSDIIRVRSPRTSLPEGVDAGEFFATEKYLQDGSRFTRTTLRVAGREMTSLTRRDPDVHTVWTLEHLLKDEKDLEAYLQLPDELFEREVDVSHIAAEEEALGDAGIVMLDTGDPICAAAALFAMGDYTVVAMTEPKLFHRLLEKLARPLHERTREAAQAVPARLWRIYGSEYASEPYLPPRLYEEYVVRYTQPMVEAIHAPGGYARIHSHGRLKAILPHIQAMGADAVEPIEPPPSGDVELIDVRRRYGRDMVLMGNIEVRDIENMAPEAFEKVVARALAEGTAGQGRGFVLMPSAAPYGRTILPRVLENYRTMIRLAEELAA